MRASNTEHLSEQIAVLSVAWRCVLISPLSHVKSAQVCRSLRSRLENLKFRVFHEAEANEPQLPTRILRHPMLQGRGAVEDGAEMNVEPRGGLICRSSEQGESVVVIPT